MATDTAVEWDQTVTCLRGYIYKEKEKIHHILHFWCRVFYGDEPDDQLLQHYFMTHNKHHSRGFSSPDMACTHLSFLFLFYFFVQMSNDEQVVSVISKENMYEINSQATPIYAFSLSTHTPPNTIVLYT